MEKNGIASVWVGNATSAEAVKEFLRIRYTEDGDSILSSFARAFSTEDNDPDFTEWMHHESLTHDVRKLLDPHSYSKQISPKIIRLIGESLSEAANTVILLHNFEYDGSCVQGSGDGVDVRFVGSVYFDSEAE